MDDFERLVLDLILSRRHEIVPKISYHSDTELMNKFQDVLAAVNYQNAPPISVYISCSYQKYSFIASQKKGDSYSYYMFYDKHLMEYYGILNSIFLCEQESEADLWKFSYQIFSEETYMEDEKIAALYTSMNFNALEDYNCSNEFDNPQNIQWIDIQTDYIFAHEIGHWLYSLQEYQIDRDKALEEIQEILEAVYDSLLRTSAEYNELELISETLAKLRQNGDIIEECFCDAVAFSYIFSKVENAGYNNIDKKEAVKSLFLCIFHTQILSLCNYTVSEQNNYEIISSVRFAFVRNYISCFLEGCEIPIFNEFLTDLGETYERKITSYILKAFTTIETRISTLYDNIDADNNISILRDILSD